MAKFLPGPMVSAVSGSAGGTVFSRNKGGAYTRNRSIPTNPQTAKQATYRGALAALSQGFRNLTAAQRDGWNSNAGNFPYQDKLGQTKYYTGQQLYIKFGLSLASVGMAQSDTPPDPIEVPAPILTGFTTLDPTSFILAFTESAVPANTSYVFFATGNRSPGVSNPGFTRYRRLQYVAAAGDPESDLISEFSSIWSAPSESQKIFSRVRAVSTVHGQSSPWVSVSDIVAAAP